MFRTISFLFLKLASILMCCVIPHSVLGFFIYHCAVDAFVDWLSMPPQYLHLFVTVKVGSMARLVLLLDYWSHTKNLLF